VTVLHATHQLSSAILLVVKQINMDRTPQACALVLPLPVAVAGALGLGVGEVVNELHLLNQVSANACNHITRHANPQPLYKKAHESNKHSTSHNNRNIQAEQTVMQEATASDYQPTQIMGCCSGSTISP